MSIANQIEAAKQRLAKEQERLAALEKKAAEAPRRQRDRDVTEIREIMLLEEQMRKRYGCGYSGLAEIVRKAKKDGIEPVVATGQVPSEALPDEADASDEALQAARAPEIDAMASEPQGPEELSNDPVGPGMPSGAEGADALSPAEAAWGADQPEDDPPSDEPLTPVAPAEDEGDALPW